MLTQIRRTDMGDTFLPALFLNLDTKETFVVHNLDDIPHNTPIKVEQGYLDYIIVFCNKTKSFIITTKFETESCCVLSTIRPFNKREVQKTFNELKVSYEGEIQHLRERIYVFEAGKP